MAKGGQATYLLRVSSKQSVNLQLKILTYENLAKRSNQETIFIGMVAGVFLAMVFYNLFLFTSLRDCDYLYYILFAVVNGHLNLLSVNYPQGIFEWFGIDWWNLIAPYRPLAPLTAFLFTRSFLQTKVETPFLDKVFLVYITGLLLFIPLSFILPRPFIYNVEDIYFLFGIVLLIIAGFKGFKRGFSPSNFYLIGLAFFVVGMGVYLAQNEGFLPTNAFTLNSHIGFQALEMLLMSLALSYTHLQRWTSAGMPHLSEFLSTGSGNTTCEESSDPELRDHLIRQRDDSWRSRNETRNLPMFACTGSDSLKCFQQKRNGQSIFPDVSEDSSRTAWKRDPISQMRVVTELPERTQYWIRASTDGRFVGYGASVSGIIDLQGLLAPNPSKRVISINALYDPTFFPDDSGFVFQGSRTGFCNMSILRDSDTASINFNEDACSMLNSNRLPLYQSIGASLDGDDYLAAASAYQRDSGTSSTMNEHIPSEDPTAESSNQLWLYPIAYDGETWARREVQTFNTPFEIDWQVSYSNQLISSRLQGKRAGVTRTLGYNLYKLTRDSNGAYKKARVAQLCTEGLKGAFSFDDRFFITYSYIRADHWRLLGYASATDPAFVAKLNAGTANIFLNDLYTGKRTVLTNMGASQYALFPHFRSDGWIYFEVYDSAQRARRVVVSDAAILAERADPID